MNYSLGFKMTGYKVLHPTISFFTLLKRLAPIITAILILKSVWGNNMGTNIFALALIVLALLIVDQFN